MTKDVADNGETTVSRRCAHEWVGNHYKENDADLGDDNHRIIVWISKKQIACYLVAICIICREDTGTQLKSVTTSLEAYVAEGWNIVSKKVSQPASKQTSR